MTRDQRQSASLRKPAVVALDDWLAPRYPAERLAALRILIGGFAVVYYSVSVVEFARLVDNPASRFVPRGIVRLIGEPLDPVVFWSWYGLTIVLGVAFTAGARFRVSGPAFAVSALFWASYHSSWGQMLHFEHLLSLHLLILGIAPAHDCWSVDARAERRRLRSPVACERYGWAVRLLAITTVATYAIAGITKLRMSGLQWIDGTTLANHIGYSATRLDLLGAPTPMVSTWIVDRPWLVASMATSALVLELLAPVALFGRVPKWLWSAGVLAMHLGIVVTMGVFFPYQTLGFALLPLFRAERPLRTIAKWNQRRARRASVSGGHSGGSIPSARL